MKTEGKIELACKYACSKLSRIESLLYSNPELYHVVRYKDEGKQKYVIVNTLGIQQDELATKLKKFVEQQKAVWRQYCGTTEDEAFEKWKSVIPGNPSLAEMKMWLAIAGIS